ncbi:MAG TPA: hypothetical protein VLL74_00310 [Methanoregula sp.]|nr:hypothetical protein [Methanoregula sp.]
MMPVLALLSVVSAIIRHTILFLPRSKNSTMAGTIPVVQEPEGA